MQPLNAFDAIAPAFTRTHETLFKPFRAGRAWKLACSSYIAYCGSMFIPFPLFFLLIPRSAYAGAPFALLLLCLTVIPFLIYLVILYCGVRMEFVVFEMVVTRSKFIAPMWRRYGARTWPWLGVTMAIGTVLTAIFLPLGVRQFHTFMALTQNPAFQAQPGASPDPAAFASFFGAIMGFYAFMIGYMMTLKLISTFMNDFILPFYALEEISLPAALRRGWSVVAADPWQVLLYLVMKFILSIVGYIMLEIALIVCMIPFFLLIIAGMALGHVLLHTIPGVLSHLLFAAGAVVLYLALLALVCAAVGYLMNLLDSYAVYFLGGRYPRLGDYLDPPTPTYTYTPPPVFPSTDERNDDTGDPPLPMDPALA